MKKSQTTAIITCKGRLEHLKKTVKHFENQGFEKIIVVDYDCPDGTYMYLQKYHPTITPIIVQNKPIFNLSDARNIGAKVAKSSNILFIDADIIMNKGALQEMEDKLCKNSYVRIKSTKKKKRKHNQTEGTVLIKRKDFYLVGEYDTIFDAWGGEDTDLYNRLNEISRQQKFVDTQFFSSIEHNDNLRTKFHNFKNLNKQFTNTTRMLTTALAKFRRANFELTKNQKVQLRDQLRRVKFFLTPKNIILKNESSCYRLEICRRYFLFGPVKFEVKKIA